MVAQVIGYIRICRPGSVIGPQQHYLKEMEQKCWRMGDQHRAQLQAQNLRVQNGLGEPSSVDYGDEEGDASGGHRTSPMKPMRSGEIPLFLLDFALWLQVGCPYSSVYRVPHTPP